MHFSFIHHVFLAQAIEQSTDKIQAKYDITLLRSMIVDIPI